MMARSSAVNTNEKKKVLLSNKSDVVLLSDNRDSK